MRLFLISDGKYFHELLLYDDVANNKCDLIFKFFLVCLQTILDINKQGIKYFTTFAIKYAIYCFEFYLVIFILLLKGIFVQITMHIS